MKKLDRYIISGVFAPFIAAQAVFVVMFIGTEALTEATKLIARYGLPWQGVVQMLMLRIPWAIGWTMPMSVGMAVILAVGRICRDVEYTPMIVGGMSYKRMLVPLVGFALVVGGAAYWIEEYLGPKTMMDYYTLKLKMQAQANAQQFELHQPLTDRDSKRRATIDAASLDPKRMTLSEVQITVWDDTHLPKLVVFARRALWRPDFKSWQLQEGMALEFGREGTPPISTSFGETDVRQVLGNSKIGGGLVFESSPNQMAISTTDKPDYLVYGPIREHVRMLEERKATRREINRVKVHIHRRSTLSFSCLVFLIIGSALAVRPQRGQALGAAFAMGVGLLLTYYILWNATCFLAEGSAYPGLMCWSTNIFGLLFGVYLTARVPD